MQESKEEICRLWIEGRWGGSRSRGRVGTEEGKHRGEEVGSDDWVSVDE